MAVTDTPEALAEQWADPEFWKLCEAKGASSEQVAESARGVIRALLTEIAEAEKERDDWQDHFAHADQERQAAEADRDRYKADAQAAVTNWILPALDQLQKAADAIGAAATEEPS